MKINRFNILIIPAIIIASIIPRCAPDGEKKFSSGAELYKSGNTEEAAREFGEGIISFVSKKSFSEANIISCDNALYVRDGKKIKIIYPVKIKIEAPADYNIISFDPLSNRTAATNGADIKIYDAGGSSEKIISPADNDKIAIKAILLNNNDIIYYTAGIIYSCNINTGEAKTITDARFECPFVDTFYSVRFYLSGNLLAAVVGIAGVYNLSVIDLIKNTALIKNREIASSKLLFSGDDIYYITGKSGMWALNHLAIKINNIVKTADLTDITDVEFSTAGLIFENNSGVWFLRYDGSSPDNLPFKFELAGGCCGYTLLKYKDDAHVSDMLIFREKLDRLKNTAPEIFVREQNKNNPPR